MRSAVGVVAILLTALVASPAQAAELDDGAGLHAQILRDSHGIPNIIGSNFADMGFGYGYAFAEDNICEIAESYVTVNGQRSRFTGQGLQGTFGPGGSYQQRGNGFPANNLESDFFYQRIKNKNIVEGLLAQPPPDGPVDEIREGVRGYVAGYNKYLAETGVNNLPDPRCAGKPWVRPITEMDAYRRFYQLALLASQTVAINGIADAKTPGNMPGSLDPNSIAQGLLGNLSLPIGSNAIALGSQGTANGSGMLLGNPHFPWDGPERFYQAHLMIPGKLNVSGGSLYGVPLVLIGHTDNLAWSHTVSTAYRFTPWQETLVPGAPTKYLYNGQPRDMEQDSVTIKVNNAGTLSDMTRTIYSTVHGPVIDDLVGVPLPWTPAVAFSMGDVNATNFRYLNHFFFTDQAQSVGELDAIEKKYEGIPWVNTIAADSGGKAYYADIGAIPNVSNAKAQQCNSAIGVATTQLLGLPVLDSVRPGCSDWDDDNDAVADGIFGPSHLPSLTRDDYVTNSNDSYWLANPAHPLEGFARIIGDERTARTLRTRLGLRITQQGMPFTRQSLQDAVFNDRQYAGELWREDLVDMCESSGGTLPGSSGPVDVSAACPVLANWDVHDNLDSKGAILFRRFATRALASPGGLPVGDPSVFAVGFDPNDPVNTPNGLATTNPKVQQALADAVTDLQDAGIPLDAPLRGYQYETRNGEKIPIHGGPGDPLGVFNAINVGWSANPSSPGYTNVPHGSSFVMVTSFGNGCPDDRTILTYSQSENPNSPYFADQTKMFSNKEWVDPPFCLNEVLGNPALTGQDISTPSPSSTATTGCKAKKKKHKKHAKKRRCGKKHKKKRH